MLVALSVTDFLSGALLVIWFLLIVGVVLIKKCFRSGVNPFLAAELIVNREDISLNEKAIDMPNADSSNSKEIKKSNIKLLELVNAEMQKTEIASETTPLTTHSAKADAFPVDKSGAFSATSEKTSEKMQAWSSPSLPSALSEPRIQSSPSSQNSKLSFEETLSEIDRLLEDYRKGGK